MTNKILKLIQILVVGTKRGKTGGSQSRVVIGLLLIGPDSQVA